MRVKIDFPQQKHLAALNIAVRIGDINYGGHVGNDAILSMMHEARMQWLQNHGLTELNAGGHGLIMADSAIAYKGEGFYGDVFDIKLFVANLTLKSFDLLYRVTTSRKGVEILIAEAKTGMICFDYHTRKITAMNDKLKALLEGLEN